jgi:hypothetical protein
MRKGKNMSSEDEILRQKIVQITHRKKMPAARKARIRALICGLPAGNFPMTDKQGAWVQPEKESATIAANAVDAVRAAPANQAK